MYVSGTNRITKPTIESIVQQTGTEGVPPALRVPIYTYVRTVPYARTCAQRALAHLSVLTVRSHAFALSLRWLRPVLPRSATARAR